jgi:cytochrome c oxidase subunit IV
METPKRPNYSIVFVILLVSTLTETLVSYLQQETIKIPVLAVSAVFKVLLVLLFFMHLKYDTKLFTYLFIAGCILVIPLILVITIVMPKIV